MGFRRTYRYRYRFLPKDDITVRELADIICAYGLILSERDFRRLDCLKAQRHFVEHEEFE